MDESENPFTDPGAAIPAHRPESNCPYRLSADRVLIIPDVHQDLAWVRAILEYESGGWDHAVFLGDYFDSFCSPPEVATPQAVSEFLIEAKETYQERITLLWGNHDIPYLELMQYASQTDWPVTPLHSCSGFNRIRAWEIAKVLPADFIWKGQLFVEVNGCVLSHAGIHPSHWPASGDPLSILKDTCEKALQELTTRRRPILASGTVRGGLAEFGGVTWLDWHREFEDEDPLPPQIVGHTPSRRGPGKNGLSWCLDQNQTGWALLDRAGNLEVRYLPGRT